MCRSGHGLPARRHRHHGKYEDVLHSDAPEPNRTASTAGFIRSLNKVILTYTLRLRRVVFNGSSGGAPEWYNSVSITSLFRKIQTLGDWPTVLDTDARNIPLQTSPIGRSGGLLCSPGALPSTSAVR